VCEIGGRDRWRGCRIKGRLCKLHTASGRARLSTKSANTRKTLLRSRLLSGFSGPFSLDVVDAVAHEIARRLAWPIFLLATDLAYEPRSPETTLLYQVVAEQLETFLARQQERDRPVPLFVEKCGATHFSTNVKSSVMWS